MDIREHQSLSEYTALSIGGMARWFVDVSSIDEVREALAFARQRSLRWAVLGAGQSTLIADAGFDGLVLRCVGSVRQHLHAGSLVFAGDQLGSSGSVGSLALHGQLDVSALRELHWMTPEGVPQVVAGERWVSAGLQHAPGVLTGVVPIYDIQAPADQSRPSGSAAQVFAPHGGAVAASIADVGWSGKGIGHITFWSDDPTWIIAQPGATADEVVQAMSLVKQQVRDTLGVQLRDAITYVGM